MASDDLIPCEICDELVMHGEYSSHILRCLRATRITGFILRHQRYEQQDHEDDGDEDEGTSEQESEHTHAQEISQYTRYMTRNSQVSRMSLQDFINDHFNGVASPPTRSVLWFNITSLSSSPSSYEGNMRLGEMLGKVETGLTQDQLKEVSYSSSDKEELVLEQDDVCPICQENLNVVVGEKQVCVLACSHLYCDDCIKTWLKKNKKCPVCMVDLEDAYCWGR